MKLSYNTTDILWSRQCQLTHLTMDCCSYNQYPAVLQQFSYLKTLGLNRLYMNIDNMSNISFTTQLTCLSINRCLLSIQQLKLLVTNTTALRDLSIGFHEKLLDSIDEVYNWENSFRTELNILNKLEFFFCFKLSSNFISFDSILVPFRESFWLNEKRWFVECEYILDRSKNILLYTIPSTMNNDDFRRRTYGILFQQNNYYLTKREEQKPINIVPWNVSNRLSSN
jgi:hypothetical protein